MVFKLIRILDGKVQAIHLYKDQAQVSKLSVAKWKQFEEDGFLIMPFQDLWDFQQHANLDVLS